MKVAFIAGFFAPVEPVIKAHFLDLLERRQLVWMPQAANADRDPDLDNLSRKILQSLASGNEVLLVHADPHSRVYRDALESRVSQWDGRNPKVRLRVQPRNLPALRAAMVEWFGGSCLEPLPTIESLEEVLGESRLLCVSHHEQPSFATVFKNLGIPRTAFGRIARELRVRHSGELEQALRDSVELSQSWGLLEATAQLERNLPSSVRSVFEDRSWQEVRPVGAVVRFLASLKSMRNSIELARASLVQRSLMPGPRLGTDYFDAGARFTPYRPIGGDFYDWFDFGEGRLGLVLADVSGKGPDAALLATRAQAIIRDRFRTGRSPSEVVRHIHDDLRAINDRNGSSNRYLELFCALLDAKMQQIVYCYAGHTPPIIRRSGGALTSLEANCTLPGLNAGPVLPTVCESMMDIVPGDQLFAFTDGIAEGDEAQKLVGALELPGITTAESTASQLMDVAEQRAIAFTDDATALVVIVKPLGPIGPMGD